MVSRRAHRPFTRVLACSNFLCKSRRLQLFHAIDIGYYQTIWNAREFRGVLMRRQTNNKYLGLDPPSRKILDLNYRLPRLMMLVVVILSVGTLVAQGQEIAKLLEAMSALNEAQQLVEQGRPKQIHAGIEKYKQVQMLLHTAGQPIGEAAALAGMGMAYSMLEEWGNAIDSFNQAITLAHTLKEPFIEATALGGLAFTYTSSHQYAKAVPTYENALKLLESQGDKYDRTIKGGLLTGLGLNCVMIGEQQKGFGYFDQALALKRSLQDVSGEAQVLTAIGVTYSQLGQRQKAFDYLTKALQISRDIGDKHQEIVSLGTIASIYRDAGENKKALDYFEQVLAYRRSKEDRNGESDSLAKIAGVYSNMGEVEKAFEYFNQALQIKRDTATLNNLGELYSSMGEFQKAFDYYSEALSIEQAEDDRRAQASTLANIGSFYFDMGELQKALGYFSRALPIMHAMNDPSGEAHILGRVGAVQIEEGDPNKALDSYKRILEIFRSTDDRFGEVNALINLGGIYAPMGEVQKALDYYGQALPIARQIKDRIAIATILNNTGEAYRLRQDHKKALDYYKQALDILQSTKNQQKVVWTLGNIAKEERSLGDLARARSDVESALVIFESLRTNVTSRDLRASFFAKAQGYFEFYIDLLMDLHKAHPKEGFDVLALQASERARARSLMETLVEARANIRQGVDLQLLERERSLQQQLDAQALLEAKLQAIPHTEAQTTAIATEIEGTTTGLQQIQAQIRNSSPHYATLTQPQPLTLSALQTQLDEDTLLLEFSLGEARSYVWAVTSKSISSYQLPKRKEIEDIARGVYELMMNPEEWATAASHNQTADVNQLAYPETAVRLSQLLLSPVATQLGKKRLLIVSDGILQYIPFAALPTPEAANQNNAYRPMILDHEIVSLPSASTLAVLRREMKTRRSPDRSLVVLADPVFERDDERIKIRDASPPKGRYSTLSPVGRSAEESGLRGSDFNLKRLPWTKREADQICDLVPASQRKEVLGFAANRSAATSADLGSYRYVHFATHGLLNSRHPELSGIVLTLFDQDGAPQDGFLRAHEIFNLRLNADLVVLSACQTGLGKNVRGEGLLGLTRGFMYAGAPRVVVSLWSVSDIATAELMTRFYRQMITNKLRPSKALQEAQISMLNEKRFAPPFFWAAFTFQGEWR
jgi:CHAT domain-containing protein/Tfp pilus assembly protein PilF